MGSLDLPGTQNRNRDLLSFLANSGMETSTMSTRPPSCLTLPEMVGNLGRRPE